MSCSGEIISEEEELIQIKSSIVDQLKKAKYGVADHSTVGLCHWTKKAFRGEGNCYKHKFYGISTHQCMEFSPAGMHCENRCVYCWRPMEFYDSMKMNPEQVAEPEVIMIKLMEERRKLIVGHYGNEKCDKKLIDESLLPSHYAISLSGEPTMYPKLPALIKYLKSLEATKSIFLVTNGQEPDMIQRLQDEDAMPTQLYLSCNAPDKDTFMKINRPRYEDSWERWNETCDMLKSLDTRTVLRITLIRNFNTDKEMIEPFAHLLNNSQANFIELKSYMHIGRSTGRLEHEDMLFMEEVRDFASQIVQNSSDYAVMDESEISRIVVLQNIKKITDRWIAAYAQTT